MKSNRDCWRSGALEARSLFSVPNITAFLEKNFGESNGKVFAVGQKKGADKGAPRTIVPSQ